MTNRELRELQEAVCRRFGTSAKAVRLGDKVGISRTVLSGVLPLNGLRHPPEAGTSGWYIWAGGEIPQDDRNFFEPLHVKHILDWAPDVIPYLGLPPGYRFLLAPDVEDVWQDTSLVRPPV